jgi:hypothetical protein
MAAKGNSIIVSDSPRGVFSEGYVNAALSPGVVVQIDVSEGEGDDGRFDFEAFAIGDGLRTAGPIYILLEDIFQGKAMTAAYVSGDRCRVYVPIAGEEFNMILEDVSGTGDDHALGDLFILDAGTGKLIATTGSPESEPFMNIAVVTDPTGDTLNHVMYTGY